MSLLDLLREVVDFLSNPGGGKLDLVITALFLLPIPPVDNPAFKTIFGYTWAFGMILSVVFGLISALFVLGRNNTHIGSIVPLVTRVLFFIQCFVVGLVSPVIVGLMLWLADLATDAVKKVPTVTGDANWFAGLIRIIEVLNDPLGTAVMNWWSWAFTFILTGVTSILTLLVLPALALTPIFFACSIAGEGGLRFWRLWVSFLIVTIVAKPVIAWTLCIGNICLELMNQLPGVGDLTNWGAIGLLGFACAIPFLLLIFSTKKVAPHVGPAGIHGNVQLTYGGAQLASLARSGLNVGTNKLGDLASNSLNMRLENVSTGGNAGSKRIAAAKLANLAGSAASLVPHPAARAGSLVALGAGTVFAASGHGARTKQETAEQAAHEQRQQRQQQLPPAPQSPSPPAPQPQPAATYSPIPGHTPAATGTPKEG